MLKVQPSSLIKKFKNADILNTIHIGPSEKQAHSPQNATSPGRFTPCVQDVQSLVIQRYDTNVTKVLVSQLQYWKGQ